jgi:hypothetical protein
MSSRRSGTARVRAAGKPTPAKLRSVEQPRPTDLTDHASTLRLLEERVDDNLACVRQALAIVDLVLKDARIARRDGALHALQAQLAAARAALLRTRDSTHGMHDQLDEASEGDPSRAGGPAASSRAN